MNCPLIDKSIFNSSHRRFLIASKPILLCVSYITSDNRLDDFCSLNTSGTKLLVGNGPYLDDLKRKYNDVIFVGIKSGVSLAHYYANSDVVVCPVQSMIQLEPIACGTPIATYPTIDNELVIVGKNCEIDNNLNIAIEKALKLDRNIVEYSINELIIG